MGGVDGVSRGDATITVASIIESILGESSGLYRIVTEEGVFLHRKNGLAAFGALQEKGKSRRPCGIEMCKRFSKLEQLTESAYSAEMPQIRLHLARHSVQREVARWIREIALKNFRTDYVEKVATMCVILRDFEHIQSSVLAAWTRLYQNNTVPATGSTAVSRVDDTSITTSKKESRRKHVHLQHKVQLLLATFAHKYVGGGSATAADAVPPCAPSNTKKRAAPEPAGSAASANIHTDGPRDIIWMQELERTESEAKLAVCAEIIKNQNDTQKTFKAIAVYCALAERQSGTAGDDTHVQPQTTPPPTAKDIQDWYERRWQRAGGNTHNVQLTCALHAYRSSPLQHDYLKIQACTSSHHHTGVAESPGAPDAPTTMCELEIVVFYCSTLIHRVDSTVLRHLLPIDINKFKSVEGTYDKLRAANTRVQESVLATVQDISFQCQQLYQSCMEIEMCLRMFIYARMQEEEGIMLQLRHFLQNNACSVQDNLERALQEWITASQLSLGNCNMTVSLLRWGGNAFVIFCMQTDVALSSRPNPYIMVPHDTTSRSQYEYFTDMCYCEHVELMPVHQSGTDSSPVQLAHGGLDVAMTPDLSTG